MIGLDSAVADTGSGRFRPFFDVTDRSGFVKHTLRKSRLRLASKASEVAADADRLSRPAVVSTAHVAKSGTPSTPLGGHQPGSLPAHSTILGDQPWQGFSQPIPSPTPGTEQAASSQRLDVIAHCASTLAGELYRLNDRHATVFAGEF